MTSRTGPDAIAAALARSGTRYLFGMPGGGNNLDVIGACEAAGIEFVLAHTETGAAIMATAYAELTESVGACVVTRGPGAASAVNGAAQAHQDRQPLLVLCDTVDVQSSVRIAHQNIDQRALFAPVTKWTTTLGRQDPDSVMDDAVAAALSAPRGAVHIDIDAGYLGRETPPDPAPTSESLGDVAGLINAASRPVLVVGVGARPHAATIRRLVDGTHIPVLMTYKARGVVPDSGPNSAGPFTGARTESAVLDAADLILTIGLDSIELIPNPWDHEAPVISLAEHPDRLRYFEPEVSLIGSLVDLVDGLPELPDGWPDGFAARFRTGVTRALCAGPTSGPGVAPWDVVRLVRDVAPAASVATVDAGAHMLAVMPLWSVEEPGQVLISSGLATMGYAVPAAVGAALARPDQRVFCFVGDGGLGMVLGELETVARLRLAVTVVVFNDASLSLIRVKQRPEGHGDERAVRYSPIDFAAVGAGLGLSSMSVRTADELYAALAADVAGPRLLDVLVDPDTYRHVIDVTRNGGTR